MLFLWWCPFKVQKEKQVGLQFTSTDYVFELSIDPSWNSLDNTFKYLNWSRRRPRFLQKWIEHKYNLIQSFTYHSYRTFNAIKLQGDHC